MLITFVIIVINKTIEYKLNSSSFTISIHTNYACLSEYFRYSCVLIFQEDIVNIARLTIFSLSSGFHSMSPIEDDDDVHLLVFPSIFDLIHFMYARNSLKYCPQSSDDDDDDDESLNEPISFLFFFFRSLRRNSNELLRC